MRKSVIVFAIVVLLLASSYVMSVKAFTTYTSSESSDIVPYTIGHAIHVDVKTDDPNVDHVVVEWWGPPINSMISSVTVPLAARTFDGVLYHFASDYTPLVAGTWEIIIHFYDVHGNQIGSAHTENLTIPDGLQVVPEFPILGSIGAVIAMFAAFAMFAYRKSK